ncbi:MAG TPA: PH domain-containing protein [Halococcus sp.]|nr:PH domain-containing protein [Halococcus sp.]
MKLHPYSLVFRALRGAQIGAVALPIVGIGLAAGLPVDGVLIPALVAGVVIGVGFQVLYYHRFEYELTTDTLDIDSGVFSRREREIPVRRIQNVDISRGIAQRALAIAAVDVETAGGGETEASLKYVSYEEAKRLQRTIQRRKRGETDDSAAVDEHAEREDLLFELSVRNLVLLGLVAPDLRALVPVLLFVAPTFGLAIPDVLTESGAVAASPRGAALAVVSWVVSGVVTAARYYDFRLTHVDDELRYERGLFSRYDGSIPLDKIQQIDITENVLMRRFGYAALAIETAGYTASEGSGGSEAAIPLAERKRVFDLAREIEGFDFDDPEFIRPPRRARRRYAVRYALAVVVVTGILYAANTVFAVRALRFWYLLLFAFVLVPVAAHYKWLHRGYDMKTEHVLTRNGFWRRTISVVPAYRVQTIIQTATVSQRWRTLASVEIDTAGSLSVTDRSARAVDFDAGEITELRGIVRKRLHESLVARRQHPNEAPDTQSE